MTGSKAKTRQFRLKDQITNLNFFCAFTCVRYLPDRETWNWCCKAVLNNLYNVCQRAQSPASRSLSPDPVGDHPKVTGIPQVPRIDKFYAL
jgi:hypothetical protein